MRINRTADSRDTRAEHNINKKKSPENDEISRDREDNTLQRRS